MIGIRFNGGILMGLLKRGIVILLVGFIFIGGWYVYETGFDAITGFSLVEKKPELSIIRLDYDGEFNLGSGCYVKITGDIVNSGNAYADGVRLSCSTFNKNGKFMGEENSEQGSIDRGSNKRFELNVDTECLKSTQGIIVKCETQCSNC